MLRKLAGFLRTSGRSSVGENKKSEIISLWKNLSDDLKLDVANRWRKADKELLEKLSRQIDDFENQLLSSLRILSSSSKFSESDIQRRRELEAAIRDFHSLVHASRVNRKWFSRLSKDVQTIINDFEEFVRISQRRKVLKTLGAAAILASLAPRVALPSSIHSSLSARLAPGVITVVGSTLIKPLSKDDVELIYIYYRAEGSAHELVLTGKDIELLSGNHIELDGFVISIHIWTRRAEAEPSIMKVRGSPYILSPSSDSISVGLPLAVGAAASIPLNVLPPKYARAVSSGSLNGLRGWAFGSIRVVKGATSADDFFPISLLGMLVVLVSKAKSGYFKGFAVFQKGARQLGKISLVEKKTSDDLIVRYIGSPSRLSDVLAKKERFRIAAREVHRIESGVGADLAEYLTILESNVGNASVHEKSVSILLPLFLSKTDEEFALTVRHETLHLADLKFKTYYILESWWRNFRENLSRRDAAGNYFPSILGFIKESSFFGIFPEAGHPMSSPFEFATSFLHTAFFPELLRKRFSEMDSVKAAPLRWQYLLLLCYVSKLLSNRQGSEKLRNLLLNARSYVGLAPAIVLINASLESFRNAANGLNELNDIMTIIKEASSQRIPVFIVETRGLAKTTDHILSMKNSSWRFIQKNNASAFDGTSLAKMLASMGVNSVLVLGSDQGNDIFYTCRDARKKGLIALTSFSLIQGRKSSVPQKVTGEAEAVMYTRMRRALRKDPVIRGTTEYFRNGGRTFKVNDASVFPEGVSSLEGLVEAYRKIGVWLFPDLTYLYFLYCAQ